MKPENYSRMRKTCLNESTAENWLQAKAIVGLFPANSTEHDNIEVYDPADPSKVIATLSHLRQQRKKAPGLPNYCLSDFIRPQGQWH